MNKGIQAIRGMHDILPDQTSIWRSVEAIICEVLDSYGYRQIRLPIVEKTELFRRSIGEVTDIVEKEMYSFEDRNGDSLTLRPEGTAGCLRACLEHGLIHNQVQKLWYQGPMFRHERPQKGRYRQFHQVGVEVYGVAESEIDAELIILTARLWRRLGIEHNLALEINSLGSASERAEYRGALIDYFNNVYDDLDADSQRRLHTNPLRILDSKNPQMHAINREAPSLLDFLGESSKTHFEGVTDVLDELSIRYTVNPRLVRGLDYYCNTVFEWITTELGAQGTVCAGGRYDGLIEQLSGRANFGTGFALGMERLIALAQAGDNVISRDEADIFMIRVGEAAQKKGLVIADQLRNRFANLKLLMHCGDGSFKSQFKKADKSGARYAVILGEDEMAKNIVGIKSLRTSEKQVSIPQADLANIIIQQVLVNTVKGA